jgi:hypothetical protein
MRYEAYVGFWNGASYGDGDIWDINAENLQEAIKQVQSVIGCYDVNEDYDLLATLTEENGDEVWSKNVTNNVAWNIQQSMDETWDDIGEYGTEHLGVLNGEWYMWRSNGGSRGAFDRTDGSGRWIETHEMPTRISTKDAHKWLVKGGMDGDDASETIEDWMEV